MPLWTGSCNQDRWTHAKDLAEASNFDAANGEVGAFGETGIALRNLGNVRDLVVDESDKSAAGKKKEEKKKEEEGDEDGGENDADSSKTASKAKNPKQSRAYVSNAGRSHARWRVARSLRLNRTLARSHARSWTSAV